MAKAKTTTRATAPKVSAESANAFMAKLFDPLPDAELADPDLAKAEGKAMRRNWDIEMFRLKQAEALAEYYSNKHCVAVWTEEMSVAEAMKKIPAQAARDHAFDELARILGDAPAPNATALKWKRGKAEFWRRNLERDGKMAAIEAAIAADELRLAKKAT